MRKLAFLVAILSINVAITCSCVSDKGGNTLGRTDLSKEFDIRRDMRCRVEFATNDLYICVWQGWQKGQIYDPKGLGISVVFDRQGEIVRNAVDVKGEHLQGSFIDLFPLTSWRSLWADFVKPAVCWGFFRSNSHGIRVLGPVHDTHKLREPYHAELWQLRPEKKLLWRVQLPLTIGAYYHPPQFFERNGSRLILVVASSSTAHILQADTGNLLESFDYAPWQSRDEIDAYRKKCDLSDVSDDMVFRFSGSSIAFEPVKGWLAVGPLYGRRTRIISIDKPYDILRENDADIPPIVRNGGIWSVPRIEFAGGGRYLIVESELEGFYSWSSKWPTVIFETGSWQKVWEENSFGIRSVSLSHDGKTLAYIHGNDLVIKEFLPSDSQKSPKPQSED